MDLIIRNAKLRNMSETVDIGVKNGKIELIKKILKIVLH